MKFSAAKEVISSGIWSSNIWYTSLTERLSHLVVERIFELILVIKPINLLEWDVDLKI